MMVARKVLDPFVLAGEVQQDHRIVILGEFLGGAWKAAL